MNENNGLGYNENPQVQSQQPFDKKAEKRAARKEKQSKTMSNPVYVAACLVILWPVGLYYMWKNEVYNKPVRIIVSVIISIIVINNLIGIFAA
ncbi:hypothetical protein [Clostridium sp.]